MADLVTQKGLYFEDYNIGDSATSQGRTITETDIVNFAALSGDWNPIHVDAEYAKGGMFGERIAHGMLGLSIATGLAIQLGFMQETVIAFMGLDWKFRGAIKIGDTIRMKAEVAEKKPMPRLGGGLVTFNVEVVNQRDETCQKGTWTVLAKVRE
ncbi:MAG: MaoC family dehydratase N-terminal domain-containing protein [Anaerolineae bacterium]|jgi:acyl dehydratase|nr:MaoC family dehydratase N-terminal domain-containing protein [Anaerolineae bacterium]